MALQLIDNLISFIDESALQFTKARVGALYITSNGMSVGNNDENIYGTAMFGNKYVSKGQVFKCNIKVNECSNYCGIGFANKSFNEFQTDKYNGGKNGSCVFYNDSCYRTDESEYSSKYKPGHDATELKFDTNDVINCVIDMKQKIAQLTNTKTNKGVEINITSDECALIIHCGEGGKKLFTVSNASYS